MSSCCMWLTRIEMINHSHNPDGKAVRVPEGYVWSSLDCVALDLCCARYCFKTVPMLEALKLKEENGWPTEFVHQVPVARIDGTNIVTEEGLDSPLFRYNLYRYAESRGVGQQNYYVVGWDSLTETPLASLGGHLGRIDNRQFLELMTKTMYFNLGCLLWDMQKTILSYAQAHDDLTGSSLFKEFMDSFDENNDGVIDYDENGRKGYWNAVIQHVGSCLASSANRRIWHLQRGVLMKLPPRSKLPIKIGIPKVMILSGSICLSILRRRPLTCLNLKS